MSCKKTKQAKLSLIEEERNVLRTAKIRLNEIADLTINELHLATGINKSRCEELIALSQFQSLGSVGPDMAQKLWRLGYKSVQSLAKANSIKMYQNYSELVGCHVDPCVEDVFRCAIAQAKYPNLPEHLKQWWEWTDKRGHTYVTWKNK